MPRVGLCVPVTSALLRQRFGSMSLCLKDKTKQKTVRNALKLVYFLFYVYWCFSCMLVYASRACSASQRADSDLEFPGAGPTGGC